MKRSYASDVLEGGCSSKNSIKNSPLASEIFPVPLITSATGIVRDPSIESYTANASLTIKEGTVSKPGEEV